MRITFRTLDGEVTTLGVDGDRWCDPSLASGPDLDRSAGHAIGGLADAHAHLAQDEFVFEPGDPADIRARAARFVREGVMLCLDKGWRDRSVLSLLAVDPGERPDLEAAGRMLAPAGGYYPGFGREVEADGLVRVVRDEAAAPARWVKIVGDWPRKGIGAVANYPEDVLAAAVDAAHAAGVRVAIHTMAPGVASAAVRAGVDSIEHGLFLTEDDLRTLGARGGAWVPTVIRVEEVIRQIGADSSGGRLLAEGLDRVGALLPSAARHGVRVLSGTDLALPSWRVADEAARLARLGLDAEEAVASASTAVFAFAGIEHGLEPGAPADLAVFGGDPREDPGVLVSPTFVVRRGRVLRDG